MFIAQDDRRWPSSRPVYCNGIASARLSRQGAVLFSCTRRNGANHWITSWSSARVASFRISHLCVVIDVQHSSMPALECGLFYLYEGISVEIIIIARFCCGLCQTYRNKQHFQMREKELACRVKSSSCRSTEATAEVYS